MTTGVWVALLASVPLLEVASRRHGARAASLADIAGRLWRRPLGRIVLLCGWAFVGVHLFSRYTLPA